MSASPGRTPLLVIIAGLALLVVLLLCALSCLVLATEDPGDLCGRRRQASAAGFVL